MVPEGGPDAVVEADDEQIEIARCPRHGSDLLLVVVEHNLTRNREPVGAPADLIVPEGGPDAVVEADDEQIEIARSPRHGSDLLLVVVVHNLTKNWEPVGAPADLTVPEGGPDA